MAVRRLAEHAAKRRSSEIASVSRVKRRWQTQLLSDTPLEIVPVEDQDVPFDFEIRRADRRNLAADLVARRDFRAR